jgi:hypothetical protein
MWHVHIELIGLNLVARFTQSEPSHGVTATVTCTLLEFTVRFNHPTKNLGILFKVLRKF